MNLKSVVFTLLCALALTACSENPADESPATFTVSDNFKHEGFAPKSIYLTIARSNSNTPFPLTTDLEVFFGNKKAVVTLLGTTTGNKQVLQVIIPSGYLDETVDITIRTISTPLINVIFANAFTYKTPHLLEVPQYTMFNRPFKVKVVNNPTEYAPSLSLVRISDGAIRQMTFEKSEGDYVWYTFNYDDLNNYIDYYKIVASFWNEPVTYESTPIGFRPFYKFEKIYNSENGMNELLLTVTAYKRSAPVVKMGDIPLNFIGSWQIEYHRVYEYNYAIPAEMEAGEYSLSVGFDEIEYLPLDGNNIFTYIK